MEKIIRLRNKRGDFTAETQRRREKKSLRLCVSAVKNSKLILSIGIIGITAAILLISKVLFLPATPYQKDLSAQRTDEFNVIINAAIADQAHFGVFLRESSDLYEALFITSAPSDDPFILDIRSSKEYSNGHIPGAINIYWRDIAKKESLDYLDSELAKHVGAGKKDQIVVCHNTQHEEGWVALFLNMMGYDKNNRVEALVWGLAAWTQDETVAPGRWKGCVEIGRAHV